MFYIDARETELKNYFSNEAIVKNLDVGDIMFDYEGRTLIIERKTIKDLLSSIKDGRYREQKKRLFAHYSKSDVIYLIEGALGYRDNNSIYFGAIVNMLLRDNIQILHTGSVKQTITLIETIKIRFDNKTDFIFEKNNENSSNIACNYVDTIKLKKKDNLDPYNCQLIQIGQIPGLSTTKAKAILDTYGNLMNLISEIEINGIDDLKNVKITQDRKLGQKAAETLKAYLCYG